MMKNKILVISFLTVFALGAAHAQGVSLAPAMPASVDENGEGFVTQRDDVAEKAAKENQNKIVYNPKNQRDPTLSPDDFLLLQYRERQRLAALEAERQRKLAEERRKREEAERRRQLELARIKDPTIEVRNTLDSSKKNIIRTETFRNGVKTARTEYDYDAYGNVIREKRYHDGFSAYDTTEYTYDRNAYLTQEKHTGILTADGAGAASSPGQRRYRHQ